MNPLDLDVHKLLISYNHNGVLGQLTDCIASEQARFFQQAYQTLQSNLTRAKEQAKQDGKAVQIDASALSGVNGADYYQVLPDGRIRRVLKKFIDVDQWIDKTKEVAASVSLSINQAQPILIRAAYNGLWSPSGTNWQPIRSIELDADQTRELTQGKSTKSGLLVLAPKCYESILGDVASLSGVTHDSHAEFIDLGIWLAVAEASTAAHACHLRSIPIEKPQQPKVSDLIQDILCDRLPRLAEQSQQAANNILQSLREDKLLPRMVVELQGAPPAKLDPLHIGGLGFSQFDDLVAARSTQRVASPSGDLPIAEIDRLWLQASRTNQAKNSLEMVSFSWHDATPKQIGQAMHQGLADLLTRINLHNFKKHLGNQPTFEVASWLAMDESEFEIQAESLSLPAACIPRHILKYLIQAGGYRLESGFVRDHRNRTLTPARLLKMVRMLAKTFGKYFLSFQNTHPLLGIVLAEQMLDPAQQEEIYLNAGRIMAEMSLLARARGQISIIKSGPIEIAPDAIRNIVADCPGLPKHLSAGLRSNRFAPLLTFQVGLPLGPDEIVSAGLADQHDGMLERKLDKRAVRQSLHAHYIPWV